MTPLALSLAEKQETTMPPFGCYKNTIRLRSGRYFDLLDPQPDQFTLGDIAGALSKICRFGGQINEFYSVAEHSVHCAENVIIAEVSAAALMHDAAEAFCGDVVKPLKVMLSEYAAIEARVEKVIGQKFGIDFAKHHDAVRDIDRAMLIAERKHFFTSDNVVWTGEKEVRTINVVFRASCPYSAEMNFLAKAGELGLAILGD